MTTAKTRAQAAAWAIVPAGADRWDDLETLFGTRGAHGGCWCLWWRLPHAEFGRLRRAQRRRRLQALVRRGAPPGLIGYADGQPVAWVSLGPRVDFAAIEASRLLRRLDDRPVWSVVCFFVRHDRRRQGWMRRLLRAAADYAAAHGATLLEGYPLDCAGRRLTGYAGYTGVASTFAAEGFREVARPRPDLLVMRRRLRRRRRQPPRGRTS